jgi:putative ABC transport system ATP-binding protein
MTLIEKEGGLIRVADLSKTYYSGVSVIPVLRSVSMRINPGEIMAVMGPSGSGKSTLLFILGLFLSPTRGEYYFAGQDVLSLGPAEQAEFRRKQVGFVFQSADLLENSTVYENLEFPLIYAGVKPGERPARISGALERVNLGDRIHHPSNLLSGGERQRVAVARALVNNPRLILADEPTGQLDHENTQLIMDHFEHIVAAGNTSVVVVTHDHDVANRCSRLCSLDNGALGDVAF